ncbi:MAG: YCF48-related protein [Crocinitomicaceae bacterium]
MKKIFTAFSLMLLVNCFSQSNWYQVNTPTTKTLTTIDFPSPMVGYIGGEDSVLLKTIDGGQTWNQVNFTGITFLSGGYDFMRLDFVDENIGYATIGPYTGTYKTTDGGLTWTQITTSGSLCYNHGLYMMGDGYGFVGGAGCFQGENMDKISAGVSSAVTINTPSWNNHLIVDIDFNPNQFNSFGLAVSSGGRVLRTTDFGNTWDTITTHLTNTTPLTSISIVNDTLAYAGYDAGGSIQGLLISTDAGLTWASDINTGSFHYPIFYDVYKAPNGNVFSGAKSTTTGDGVIFEKDELGVWSAIDVNFPIRNMTSYNDSIVWGVGENGYVVTNRNFSQLSVFEHNTEYKLTVYPNPASEAISLQLPENLSQTTYEIEICALNGQVLRQFYNESKNLPIKNLNTGKYLLKIKFNFTVWHTLFIKE